MMRLTPPTLKQTATLDIAFATHNLWSGFGVPKRSRSRTPIALRSACEDRSACQKGAYEPQEVRSGPAAEQLGDFAPEVRTLADWGTCPHITECGFLNRLRSGHPAS